MSPRAWSLPANVSVSVVVWLISVARDEVSPCSDWMMPLVRLSASLRVQQTEQRLVAVEECSDIEGRFRAFQRDGRFRAATDRGLPSVPSDSPR